MRVFLYFQNRKFVISSMSPEVKTTKFQFACLRVLCFTCLSIYNLVLLPICLEFKHPQHFQFEDIQLEYKLKIKSIIIYQSEIYKPCQKALYIYIYIYIYIIKLIYRLPTKYHNLLSLRIMHLKGVLNIIDKTQGRIFSFLQLCRVLQLQWLSLSLLRFGILRFLTNTN